MSNGRLFQIIYYLLDKGRATAPELAKKLEVSVRTIYRDIDALSGMNIPIYAEAGRNGGIYLMPDYTLDKSVLSESEKQDILASLQSLSAAQGPSVTDTLQKLSALFQVQTKDWIEVDFSRWNDNYDHTKFADFKTAILLQKAMYITYASSYEQTTTRLIHPLQLFYKSKAWYVKAYCPAKENYRLFKLTRILAYELTNENFPARKFPADSSAVPQECNTVTLLFPKEVTYRVYDEFDRSEITVCEDGNLLVSAAMPEDAWLTGFLLSFGTQVEVIRPDYFKPLLANMAKEIYEKNTRNLKP